MPGAPEAGRDLVADRGTRRARSHRLAHRAQVARRLQQHAGRALHERLDHDRRDLVAVLGQHALERRGVTGRHAVRVEQQRPVERVEQLDPAHRDGADGVAVVGVLEAHERVRDGLPVRACCQYWNAIFSAISTAVEPLSE